MSKTMNDDVLHYCRDCDDAEWQTTINPVTCTECGNQTRPSRVYGSWSKIIDGNRMFLQRVWRGLWIHYTSCSRDQHATQLSKMMNDIAEDMGVTHTELQMWAQSTKSEETEWVI